MPENNYANNNIKISLEMDYEEFEEWKKFKAKVEEKKRKPTIDELAEQILKNYTCYFSIENKESRTETFLSDWFKICGNNFVRYEISVRKIFMKEENDEQQSNRNR